MGRDSCEKTDFGRKKIKYTKRSTPENKFLKKHNFYK